LRSFGQVKQELAGFLDEAENFRAENTVLSKQVAALTEQVREAQGQPEPVKAEALVQREGREQAELAADPLRDPLVAVAKAWSAAGLSLNAFCGEKDPTTRPETNGG
jgi:cell division septum initiation protein DivIVA